MAKNKKNPQAEIRKAAKGIARERARTEDPWFGKRRSAGEMGRHKSRAAKNKNACRGSVKF